MHVAIDLGENDTWLAAWTEGQPVSHPALIVKVPGLAHFGPEATGDPWSRAQLQKYIAYLHREYLLPTRKVIDSASAAIPGVPPLSVRRRLLDVLNETLGLEEALVVPRSLAQAAGFQFHYPQPLGDLILLEAQGNLAEATFLNTFPGITITLEGQCRGDARVIREMASHLGFLAAGSWNFDCLFISGDIDPESPLGQLAAGLPQRISVQAADDFPWAAVQGLHPQSDPDMWTGSLSVIYPYSFYLAVFRPDGQAVSLARIPFDTANLELDCNSRYKLATLAAADMCAGDEDKGRIHFGVYETNADFNPEPADSKTALGDPVLEIDCHRQDLPDRVDLVLDMGSAALLLDLPAPGNDEDSLAQGSFRDLYDQDISRLQRSIRLQQVASTAPPQSAAATTDNPPSDLDRQIDTILGRLQWLLHQWNI